jgi:hypothetical protein
MVVMVVIAPSFPLMVVLVVSLMVMVVTCRLHGATPPPLAAYIPSIAQIFDEMWNICHDFCDLRQSQLKMALG